MKKALSILGIILLSLSVAILAFYALTNILSGAPDRVTESWQTVTIGGLGTFRVPTEWNVEEENGVLFITDRPRAAGDYAIYIVGTVVGIGIQPHEVIEGVRRGNQLRSAGFSNGGGVSVFEYRVNGVTQEHSVISFNNFNGGERRDYRMFVWNREVVDQWHVEQIARTYISNRNDFDNPNAGRLMPR